MRYFLPLLILGCSTVDRPPMFVDSGYFGDAGPVAPDAAVLGDAGPGVDAAEVDGGQPQPDAAQAPDAAVAPDATQAFHLEQYEESAESADWTDYVAAGMPEAMREDGTSYGATTTPGSGTNCTDPTSSAAPINCITWATAMGYCQWIGAHAGRTARLPTLAEWIAEASRIAVTTHEDAPGAGPLPEIRSINGGGPCTAGALPLCDVYGNVSEWTLDTAADGIGHVAAGASYADPSPGLGQRDVDGSSPTVGFRCYWP